jgi:hypothetical protein
MELPVRTQAAKPRSTRPPFPISSDLAKEVKASASPAAAAAAAAPAAPVAAATPATTAANLFARPAATIFRPAAAASQFRPASPHYDFLKRLGECLAVAEKEAAA